MANAKFGPRPVQYRSCLVLFETDSGSNVRQGRDRCSSASIQVAGDTRLLQVLEHQELAGTQFCCQGHGRHAASAPWLRGRVASSTWQISGTTGQLPEQRTPRGRQVCTRFGHVCLGVPRFLLLGGSFAEVSVCKSLGTKSISPQILKSRH